MSKSRKAPVVTTTNKIQLLSLLDDLKLPLPVSRKSVFPVFPDPDQLIDILLVNLVNVSWIWGLGLHDANGPSDHDVNGASVGHHADIVVEDAASVEEGHLKDSSAKIMRERRQ